MGNYKFRLSDMIPNAWFYKLKDMSRRSRKGGEGGRNSNHQNKKKQSSTSKCSTPSILVSSVSRQHHRQSFYYSDSFTQQQQRPVPVPVYQNNPPTEVYFPVDSPRKSSKGKSRSRTRRKTVYKPSPRRVNQDNENCSRACQCQCLAESEAEAEAASFSSNSLQKNYFDSFSSTDASLEFFDLVKYPTSKETGTGTGAGAGTESRSSTCSCGFSSTTDIIIDVKNEKCFSPAAGINSDHSNRLLFDTSIPEQLDLPPILTKPTKLHHPSSSPPIKTVTKINRKETPISSRGGIKLRPNSPKLMAAKKNQGISRNSKSSSTSTSSSKKVFSESFAVVKASIDPEKDFRESMMEMILENKIKNSKDLEDLLACYLSLNSDEYHQLIINAFEQIWFHIPHL